MELAKQWVKKIPEVDFRADFPFVLFIREFGSDSGWCEGEYLRNLFLINMMQSHLD